MAEYPIQIRWPYQPPIHRAMRTMDWIKWFDYKVLFLMRSYLRMKYEMFLMDLYDFVVKLLSKTRCDWYPKEPYQDEIDKLQDKVWELEDKLMDTEMKYEREFNSYEFWHEVQDDQIERLWQWLEFYDALKQ